jgi:molybdopterin converting factor small subunit
VCFCAGVFSLFHFRLQLRVTVLLFSSYAEAFGSTSIDLELDADASVSELLARIRQMAEPRKLPGALVAVNQEYAGAAQRLSAGDEIAIIPPVAGG